MKLKIVIVTLTVLLCEYGVSTLSFPGPQVYVVTPSSKTLKKNYGDPTPFYYHNWMRRMDTGSDSSTTTTTTTETTASKVQTPDLIFAEFESDGSMQKSIRKLLEKERITPKKTTMSPIYVPDEEENKVTRVVNYGLPVKTTNYNESSTENVKYSSMSHNDYYNNVPAPVYVTESTTILPTTTRKITTTPSQISIENIWHVIDSEKSNQYSNNWEEIALESEGNEKNEDKINHSTGHETTFKQDNDDDGIAIDDNFALPGFATNPGNGAENESRAIRTEQNIRFPYINLKPFQMKLSKKPSYNNLSNDKKNNLYTNLDNFYDLKEPVRGEVHDIGPIPSIDRYNPAQPYLPQQKYGANSNTAPSKATASLVPPPPPPPPKPTGDNFPVPTSYESFPPYAPSASDFGPPSAPAPVVPPPVSISIAPSQSVEINDNSDTSGPSGPSMDVGYRYKPPSGVGDSDNSAPVMNTGYNYKPPSIPMPQFYPTPATPNEPYNGYSYSKPSMTIDTPPLISADKPEFQGYHYSKPIHSKPTNYMPPSYGLTSTYGHGDFSQSVYNHDDSPPHFIDDDDTPPHSHDTDDSDVKGGDDDNDMGMKPPSLTTDIKPGSYGPPPEDHGFPSDFPSDFKFPPDFHDHDHDLYHIIDHTTTTTETPRANRFSYYYLGKKLYYLPLYFSVYFIIYVGALIIKAVLRHKIVYPNSWRPNTTTATFFSKRSVDEYLSHENLHELTGKVTHAIAAAANRYMNRKSDMS